MKILFSIVAFLLLNFSVVCAQDKASSETTKKVSQNDLEEFSHTTSIGKKSFKWEITYDNVLLEIKSWKVTTISSEPDNGYVCFVTLPAAIVRGNNCMKQGNRMIDCLHKLIDDIVKECNNPFGCTHCWFMSHCR